MNKFFAQLAAAVVLLLGSMYLTHLFPEYVLIIVFIGGLIGAVLGGLISNSLWDYLEGDESS